jgi:hypothetical protein
MNNEQISMTNKYRIVLTLPSSTIGEGRKPTPTPTLPRGREKYKCKLRNGSDYFKETVFILYLLKINLSEL